MMYAMFYVSDISFKLLTAKIQLYFPYCHTIQSCGSEVYLIISFQSRLINMFSYFQIIIVFFVRPRWSLHNKFPDRRLTFGVYPFFIGILKFDLNLFQKSLNIFFRKLINQFQNVRITYIYS